MGHLYHGYVSHNQRVSSTCLGSRNATANNNRFFPGDCHFPAVAGLIFLVKLMSGQGWFLCAFKVDNMIGSRAESAMWGAIVR